MKKNFFYIFPVFLLLAIFLFFFISIDPKDNNWDNTINNINSYEWQTHNDELITDILNEDNYSDIWINPEDYESFWDFLEEFREYENIDFDPLDENFVIGMEDSNWDISYVPYRFREESQIFEEEVYKNLAILDIFKAYENNQIYWWMNSSSAHKIIFEKDLQHPLTYQLNSILNVNVFDKNNNINKVISDLENSTLSSNQNQLLSYFYDLKWEYNKSNENRDWDEDKTTLNLTATIIDQDWNAITWANIEFLNIWEVIWVSQNWQFEYSTEVPSFSHLRFRVTLDWYSDSFVTIWMNNYNSPVSYKDISVNFILHEADKKIVINEQNSSDFTNAKYYIVEMDWSKYFVPYDWLYYSDDTDKKYEWKNISIYLYQFTRDDNNENLLENDTFSPVSWFVWNTMKTFWMPYIQIIDNVSWKELYTKSWNPVILQNQVYHMQELFDNADRLYWELTNEDLEFLLKYSEENNWYPIDFDFLVENNFLRWPAWWTLDREKWVWKSVWHRLLDISWTVELPFYHID